MNALLKLGAAMLTMSSLEIAELVESRHDTVKLSMERLAARGVIQLPPLAEVTNRQGQSVSVYQLGKRDSYVVVAQLSPEFTARLVDRWQELESAAAPAVPRTMAQALRLAADQAEQIEHQQAQLALAAPKVEFVDRYVESTGAKGFRQVCKLLGANESRFREFLLANKVMYRLGGEWVPHAQHQDSGRFEVKAGASEGGHAFNQAKFTPKGVQWVAGLWIRAQAELQDAVQAA